MSCGLLLPQSSVARASSAKGTVLGAVLGAAIMGVIINGMVLVNCRPACRTLCWALSWYWRLPTTHSGGIADASSCELLLSVACRGISRQVMGTEEPRKLRER